MAEKEKGVFVMGMDGVVFQGSESYETVVDVHGCKQEDELSLWPPVVDYIWFQYAKTALSNYEKQENAEFVLVGLYPYTYKSLVLIPEIDEIVGDWIHMGFIAVPKGADVDDVTSMKLFFAELVYYGPRDFRVTHCSTLEPNDPGTAHGCGICNPDEGIPHPSSGYLMGRWPFENGEIPDSIYGSHWFKEEINGSTKRRCLDLDKLFKGNVPTEFVRRRMKSPDYAEIALKLNRNGEDDVEFDIIEGLGYSRCDTVFLPERSGKLGEWVHVSFTARPMNAEDGCPPKLFFAEMYDIGPANEYSLSMCCILEPNDPGISYECGFCYPESKIVHAPNYVAGHWSYCQPCDFGA